MLIAVLTPLLLLIPALAQTTQNVTKIVTELESSSDELYRRFVRTIYSKNLNNFDYHNNEHGPYYVLRPDHPIEFEKCIYYWNESHQDLKESKLICEYRIHNLLDSNELTHTYFPDGTKLRNFFFSCSAPYTCSGIECVIETSFVLGMIGVSVALLGLFLIRRCAVQEIEYMERIRRQAELFHSVTNPHYGSTSYLNPDSLEPPPPSHNAFFPTSPPSYQSVILDKVTYTLPSYSAIA